MNLTKNRNADFQSAVSPICNRQPLRIFEPSAAFRSSAEYNSAIQQITNLRYELPPFARCKSLILTFLLLITCSGLSETVPFVLPWNDGTPSVTDFSGLTQPITNDRVVVDSAGHFWANGHRIRFLGVNFAGDAQFMPTNNAEAVAARLAKFGINSVRIHSSDAKWAHAGGLVLYTNQTSTNLQPAQLERIHFLVSRLKAHGIYADVNLLVSHVYRSKDGLGTEVTRMSERDQHMLGFFNPVALQLQKDYATKLLTPTNRFTGLPLAKDPAVCFIEIINEEGITLRWFDGGIDILPPGFARELQGRWNEWLTARYKSDADLRTAWKAGEAVPEPSNESSASKHDASANVTELPAEASLPSRSVPLIHYARNGFLGTSPARRDWLEFLRDLEDRYYHSIVHHLRDSVGYQGLICGTIVSDSPVTVQAQLDIIDGHNYWQHPHFPHRKWDREDWYVRNVSMVNDLGDKNTLTLLARQRVRGKPFTVTEYQHPSPNYYGAESDLLLAAYGALQDWDGLWLFDYGPGNDMERMGYFRSFFEIGQHPTKMANLLLAANIFRRGDVQAAKHEISVSLTRERELDLLNTRAKAWELFTSEQLGVPAQFTFISRLNTVIGGKDSFSTPPAPTGSILESDTRELIWNASDPKKGFVTFDTPRTKGLVGFCDQQEFAFRDGVSLKPGPTKLGWCTLGATLVNGKSFTNSCDALIVATGWCENSGQQWSNPEKSSVGTNWGHSPVLIEAVPFTLTLAAARDRVRAWALDETGRQKQQLPVSGNSSSATLNITSNASSLWYEVQVR